MSSKTNHYIVDVSGAYEVNYMHDFEKVQADVESKGYFKGQLEEAIKNHDAIMVKAPTAGEAMRLFNSYKLHERDLKSVYCEYCKNYHTGLDSVSEPSPTVCEACNKPLVGLPIALAISGDLYCSMDCAVENIGIEPPELELITDRFVPKQIGITTLYTITGIDSAGKRFIIHTDTPYHYNIYNGTLWANRIEGDRVMVKRYDNV